VIVFMYQNWLFQAILFVGDVLFQIIQLTYFQGLSETNSFNEQPFMAAAVANKSGCHGLSDVMVVLSVCQYEFTEVSLFCNVLLLE